MYFKYWFHLLLLKAGALLQSHLLHLQLLIVCVDPVSISRPLSSSINLKRLLMGVDYDQDGDGVYIDYKQQKMD